MDENIAKYLKTYGVLVGFAALIVVLGEFGFVRLLTALLVLICFVLVSAVLIQQGKGGGLVGALGGMSGDTMFGTTATPVKKFTAAVGLLFILGVLILGRAYHRHSAARPAAPVPAREAPVPASPTPEKAPPTAPTPTPQ